MVSKEVGHVEFSSFAPKIDLVAQKLFFQLPNTQLHQGISSLYDNGILHSVHRSDFSSSKTLRNSRNAKTILMGALMAQQNDRMNSFCRLLLLVEY